ncbi:MAG: O-antigen ligase family protein [Anaerolineales bacterium]
MTGSFGIPIGPARRELIYLALAVALGLGVGLAFNQNAAEVVVTALLMGLFIVGTLRFPLEGLLLTIIFHPFINFIFLNFRMGAGIPDITLGRAVIGLLFIVVLARGILERHPFRRVTRVDLGLALTGLALTIAALRSGDITYNMQWVFDVYLAPFLLYYIAKYLVTDEQAVRRVLWAVAIIGAYNGLYGIFTQTTGQILFADGQISGLLYYTDSGSLRIMRGLLDSPHGFGLVFSLAIPIDFYLLLKTRRPAARFLLVVFLLLTLGGLFFTYKRTAWIATIASLAVIPFFFPRFRTLFIVLLVSAAFAGWFFSAQIEDSAVATERVGEGADTLNGRIGIWQTALTYVARAPILGYGSENFLARSELQAIESHYLQIALDAGLLGLIPFVLALLMLTREGLHIFRARDPAVFVEPDLVAIFWAMWLAYVISLSTVVMNHEFPHQLFFFVAGAIIGSQETILRQLETRARPAAVRRQVGRA